MKLHNSEGQTIPNVVFRTRRDHEWADVSSDEVLNRILNRISMPEVPLHEHANTRFHT